MERDALKNLPRNVLMKGEYLTGLMAVPVIQWEMQKCKLEILQNKQYGNSSQIRVI